jgi:hypothetical protein
MVAMAARNGRRSETRIKRRTRKEIRLLWSLRFWVSFTLARNFLPVILLFAVAGSFVSVWFSIPIVARSDNSGKAETAGARFPWVTAKGDAVNSGAKLGSVPSRGAGPPLTEVNERLQEAPYNNAEREGTLRRWFAESGCLAKNQTEETVTPGQPPNLICTLKGTSRSLIVVSGHTDHVRKGLGVIDDWSGASMLPSLYQSLNARPRKHTFLFIGFTEEEKGLVGSEFFVRHFGSSERRSIRAMVNLECLGLAPPEVWSHHADPQLLLDLNSIAQTLHMRIEEVNVEDVGRDDAESFRQASIPTITIHSLTQDTIRIMHSPQDNFSAVNLTDYDEAYRLVAAYLAYLDSALGVGG